MESPEARHAAGTRTYAVIGVGAVGGFIGGTLASSGRTVHFVARSNYGPLSAAGLTLSRAGVERKIYPISVFRSVAELPLTDVTVVATKTTDVAAVSAELLRVQRHTRVVGFHNGLEPETLYAGDALRRRTTLGGVAYMSAEQCTPGRVRVGDEYSLAIGAAGSDRDDAEEAAHIVEDFYLAGLETRFASDLRAERWNKVIWSLIFAGPCTILDVDTSTLVRIPPLHRLQQQIFTEAQTVAKADGVTIDDQRFDAMINEARAMPGHIVSMTADRRGARPLEDDAIYGAVRRRAVTAYIPTPTIDAVHALLPRY